MRFRSRAAEELYNGINSKLARALVPPVLHGITRRKLDYLAAATSLEDVGAVPGSRLEKLRGGRDSA
jgi:proteic killer suppression protein